jgi:hypothetical protein
LAALLLAMAAGTNACAAAKPGPALHCRHSLTTYGAADSLPTAIASQLRPWMALRGERWNRTDSIMRGDLTAGFLWAAKAKADWIVAYSVGGVACCSTRFGLFKPTAAGRGYQQVIPQPGAPDNFGDASCKGIDAVLDAYGTRR